VPNYAVGASAKDETVGSGANTTGVDLNAFFSNTLGGLTSYGKALIDTSAIGTDVISAVRVYWYHVSYTKTKAATYHRRVKVGGSAVLDSSATPAAAGWHSQDLTSGQFSLINKTGETELRFEVDDPGSTYDRTWVVQAWDYGDHSRACYLAVTHAAAGGPTKFSILR
jgi:hypothetical protein